MSKCLRGNFHLNPVFAEINSGRRFSLFFLCSCENGNVGIGLKFIVLVYGKKDELSTLLGIEGSAQKIDLQLWINHFLSFLEKSQIAYDIFKARGWESMKSTKFEWTHQKNSRSGESEIGLLKLFSSGTSRTQQHEKQNLSFRHLRSCNFKYKEKIDPLVH